MSTYRIIRLGKPPRLWFEIEKRYCFWWFPIRDIHARTSIVRTSPRLRFSSLLDAEKEIESRTLKRTVVRVIE